MIYKIPITADVPAQTFTTVLSGVSYVFKAQWNERASFWTLDMQDEDGQMLIQDIALKCGVDLLSPFNFGIGKLFAVDLTESGQEATLSNIGIDVFIVLVV